MLLLILQLIELGTCLESQDARTYRRSPCFLVTNYLSIPHQAHSMKSIALVMTETLVTAD